MTCPIHQARRRARPRFYSFSSGSSCFLSDLRDLSPLARFARGKLRSSSALRIKPNLLRHFKLICPVQSRLKNFPLRRRRKSAIYLLPSRLSGGAFRDRYERGARDAVDALARQDERRQGGRRSRVVLTPRRWRQVLRDAIPARRRWQESPVTEESAKETVKTIARGMPGVSGVTVVTCLRAFQFCTQGCGRIGRPAFPAPSILGGETESKTRAKICGEIAKLCLVVIACDKRDLLARNDEFNSLLLAV